MSLKLLKVFVLIIKYKYNRVWFVNEIINSILEV